jgi:hypothetical protein
MAEVLGGIVEKARIRDSIDLVLAIVGAGSVGGLVDTIRSWLPEQTKGMTDETLAAVASFLIFYFGGRIHSRLTAFGLGAFLSSVGAWVGAYLSGFWSMLQKKG